MSGPAEGPNGISGWGRRDWEDTADRLLEAIVPFRSSTGALFDLPGARLSDSGARSDGMEAFARTFWLAACRIPHAPEARRRELVDRYAEGLVAGADPSNAESWPTPEPTPQTMVEAGALAFGLYETREWLWPVLDDAERERVIRYLLVATSRTGLSGNWLLFRVMAHSFLRSVGIDVDPSQTAQDLDGIESCYRADGWYSDGGSATATKFDYYNAWSMNMYPLLWARMEGAGDPARVERFRERSTLHVESLLHLIGGDGGPVFQGRSLTYRAAVVSSLWAAALGDVPALDFGANRRAASGVLQHFLRNGGLADDRLSLGWHGEFEPMTQRYSGPGSPYWMSKAFLGLLLPPDHAAWTTPEQPLPVERGDFVRIEREPGWILDGTRGDGIVRLINHGTSRERFERDPHSSHLRDDPNYARFAYSTVTAPLFDGLSNDSPAPEQPLLPDSTVTTRLADGLSALREGVRVRSIGDDWLRSESRLEAAAGAVAASVEAISFAHGGTEVRLARVTTPFAGSLIVTGSAVSGRDSMPASVTDRSVSCVTDTGLVSTVAALGITPCEVREQRSGASPFGRATSTPVAEFLGVETGQWVAAAVTLQGPDAGAARPLPTVVISADRIDVDWLDGSHSSAAV